MPALFAYLLSITVFLGGAYAGLNWVANPRAKDAPIQTAGVPLHQPHPKRKPEVAVTTPSVSDPVVAANTEETTEIAAAPVVTETKPNASEPTPQSVEPPKSAESSKSAEKVGASVQPVSRKTDAAALKSNAAMDKPKEGTSKPQKIRQVEHHQRKPVMMILRTIEFADGRREQHLLPMSQARMAAY